GGERRGLHDRRRRRVVPRLEPRRHVVPEPGELSVGRDQGDQDRLLPDRGPRRRLPGLEDLVRRDLLVGGVGERRGEVGGEARNHLGWRGGRARRDGEGGEKERRSHASILSQKTSSQDRTII